MRKLIFLVALAACCTAAPPNSQASDEHLSHGVTLQRPSPISPDVLSDPKPKESVTVITDPKEIAKHKREISGEKHTISFIPTVQPLATPQQHSHESKQSHEHKDTSVAAATVHHRQKRAEQKTSSKNSHKSKTKNNKKRSPAPTPAPARDLPRHRRDVPAIQPTVATAPSPLIHRDGGKVPQNAAADIQPPQPIARPAIARVPLTQSVGYARPQTLEAHLPAISVDPTVKPLTLPIASGASATTAVKRDIPVPLVPKYQHPEESPKEEEKTKDTHAEKKDEKQHDVVDKQQHKQHVKPKSSESDENSGSDEQKTGHHAGEVQHTLHTGQLHREQELHFEHPIGHHEFHPEHVHVGQKPTEAEQPASQVSSSTPTSEGSSSSTTTEQSIIRHRPVPVAELFARPKQ